MPQADREQLCQRINEATQENLKNMIVKQISIDVMYYIADIPNPYEHISAYWTYPCYTTEFRSPFNEVRVKIERDSKATVSSYETGSETWTSTGYHHRLVKKPGTNGDISRMVRCLSWLN